MRLNTYEQEMLDGKHGEGKRFAMEKLVDFGRAIGAEEPRQERKKIFNQFYRLETKSNAQDGIGLGLWVVRMIIEEHGGEVGVEGPIGEGTVFWFKIPISKEDS